jgi:hypothetical protein
MITTPTVLVLGAGASAPYGFPLGFGLRSEIIKELRIDKGSKAEEPRIVMPHGSRPATLYSALIQKFNPADVDNFREALVRSRRLSIDAFLERNSRLFKEIGRCAIAGVILQSEEDSVRSWLLNCTNPESLTEDWFRVLYGLLSVGLEIGENRLTVITYNYDRSFENFLVEGLMVDCALGRKEAAEAVSRLKILHLHGSLGSIPGTGDSSELAFGAAITTPNIVAAGSRIRIISDPEVSRDPIFQEAHTALRSADRIYFLGFGFAEENLTRLIRQNIKSEKKVVLGTLRGFATAERTRLESFLNARNFKMRFHEMDCCRLIRECCFPSL